MLNNAAEQSFQKGMELLTARRHREALAWFRGAIEIEKRAGIKPHQPRYLSYFGLCLGLTNAGLHEAVQCCRTAAQQEGYRPDLCWNLGRVLLMAGKRREAYRALVRGLSMQRDHAGIRGELARMGRRRRPPIPFLGRGHVLNIMLGRLLRSAA